MIYVTFNYQGKEVGGVLLATYYKKSNTDKQSVKYYLVRLQDEQMVLEILQNDVILTTLNLIAEWIRIAQFKSIDSTDNAVYSDYEGYKDVFEKRFIRV